MERSNATDRPQITLLGLNFVFINVLTLLFFDVTYEGKDLPTWVYFSWAFGLFAYQSEWADGGDTRMGRVWFCV